MSTQPGARAYYIEQWSDEVVPCDCTLQGWAEWLSKPDIQWRRDAPANDGDRFTASVIRFGEDAMAVREGGDWRLFNSLVDVDFVAARFGKGMGWSGDDILSPDEPSVREWLEENPDQTEGTTVYFAIGFYEPEVTLVYHANPPRMTVEGLVG